MLQNQAPPGMIPTTPKNRTSLKKFCITIYNSFFRSSHRKCTVKKMLLKTWEILYENSCARVSFNKVAGMRACNVTEKGSNAGFEEHLRILKNICEQLFLCASEKKVHCLYKEWGKPMLDGKWHNWAINTFYWKYEHLWTSWS